MSDRLDIPALWDRMQRAGVRFPHPVCDAACHERNARDLEAELAADLARGAPPHAIQVMLTAIEGERTKAAALLVAWSEAEGRRHAA